MARCDRSEFVAPVSSAATCDPTTRRLASDTFRNNSAKHGIDFVDAQALWLDDMRIEIPARTEDEPRSIVIGMIEGNHWSAIITQRAERIRIISVRRSRMEEIAIYEG